MIEPSQFFSFHPNVTREAAKMHIGLAIIFFCLVMVLGLVTFINIIDLFGPGSYDRESWIEPKPWHEAPGEK